MCAEITGLPPGGLGCDVVVTLAVDDYTAGTVILSRHKLGSSCIL